MASKQTVFRSVAARTVVIVSVLSKFDLKPAIDFCKETTAHGPRYIVESAVRVKRYIWAAICLISLGLCCFHISYRIQTYQQFRHQESVFTVSGEEFYYPDITICNLSPFSRDQSHKVFDLVIEKFEIPFDYTPGCWQSYFEVDYPLEIGSTEGLFRVGAMEIREMSTQIEDMLVECRFGNITCDKSAFTLHQDPTYFNCYTFNTNRFLEQIKDEQGKQRVLNHNFYKLSLTLFLDSFNGTLPVGQLSPEVPWVRGFDYALSFKTLNEYGVRVAIHPQGSRPRPKHAGLSLSPGFLNTIFLEPTIVTREKYPYKSNCTEQKKLEETNVIYSQQECVEVCVQKKIMEQCSCQLVTLPLLNSSWAICGINVCNLTDLHCSDRYKGSETYYDCVDNCPKQCEEVEFKQLKTHAYWPSSREQKSFYKYAVNKNPVIAEKLGNPEDEDYLNWMIEQDLIRKNFVHIDVVLRDRYVRHVAEQAKYGLPSLFTDFGGTLGLWIGMSAITMSEVLKLLVEFVGANVKSCFLKKNS